MIHTGGFVAGLIIPHDNGFAISMVERLEDLVMIIFLPIVRHVPSCPFLVIHLKFHLVFHTLWTENQSRAARQRKNLGLHYHHLHCFILFQVLCLLYYC
jgi:hypothetical protein